jgi:hypothetical protein
MIAKDANRRCSILEKNTPAIRTLPMIKYLVCEALGFRGFDTGTIFHEPSRQDKGISASNGVRIWT